MMDKTYLIPLLSGCVSLLLLVIVLLIGRIRRLSRTEEELISERNRLELATENIGAGLAIISRDYLVTWTNLVMTRAYGNVTGRLCFEAFNHRTSVCPNCGVHRLFSGDLPKATHEQMSIDSGGNRLWVELIATPVRDRHGEVIAALEVVMPVTERKLAEERLKESEEQFRTLSEEANVGIYSINHKGLFQYVNPPLAAMLGYERHEMVGMGFREFLHHDDQDQVKFDQRISGAIPSAVYQLRVVRKDGQSLFVEIHGSTVHRDRTPSVIGTVVDITKRKNAEERLRRKREMLEEWNRSLERRVSEEVARNREKDQMMMQQSRLAAVGEMIGNIAHQWRQPLNMLGIVIQRLQMEFDRGTLSAEAMQQEVDRSLELLVYMSRTIDDFRDFFRFDRDLQQFTLGEAVGKVVRFFTAAGYTIRIDTDVPDDLEVIGYLNEFCQVLLNIFNNARDAITENDIAAPYISVTAVSDQENHILTIRDNGGGIPPLLVDRIFDPYFSTKEPGQGTGIGLYLSRIIIEKKMRGTIEAGNHGDGAEFIINLPIKDRHGPAKTLNYKEGAQHEKPDSGR